jgi:alkylation response protein AidB-like acyl-CoA dehydrogenase
MSGATAELESIESFQARAREFVAAALPRRDPNGRGGMGMDEAKALQRQIFDAGFAGIAVPTEYGGAGLTLEHQKLWADEVKGYGVPSALFVSMGMLAITLLDHGSETLKRDHIPKILRGEEVWIQLLSDVPRPHRLGRAEAQGPLDVRGAAQGPEGRDPADHRRGRWTRPLLPGVVR